MNLGQGVGTNNLSYKNAIKKARHWHGLITSLIKQADTEDIKNEGQGAVDLYSIADELMKLTELKTKGILTEAEFNKQKQKLLS